jgi:hypothetical protein
VSRVRIRGASISLSSGASATLALRTHSLQASGEQFHHTTHPIHHARILTNTHDARLPKLTSDHPSPLVLHRTADSMDEPEDQTRRVVTTLISSLNGLYVDEVLLSLRKFEVSLRALDGCREYLSRVSHQVLPPPNSPDPWESVHCDCKIRCNTMSCACRKEGASCSPTCGCAHGDPGLDIPACRSPFSRLPQIFEAKPGTLTIYGCSRSSWCVTRANPCFKKFLNLNWTSNA